jgi:hypothetical protein
MQDLENQIEMYKDKLKQQNIEISDMQAAIQKKTNSHEEEVSLRLQFENRINNLHALNRSFNDRALRNE